MSQDRFEKGLLKAPGKLLEARQPERKATTASRQWKTNEDSRSQVPHCAKSQEKNDIDPSLQEKVPLCCVRRQAKLGVHLLKVGVHGPCLHRASRPVEGHWGYRGASDPRPTKAVQGEESLWGSL